MIQTFFYSLFLFVCIIFCILKKKNIMGILLVSLYFLISINSLVVIKKELINISNITFIPYIYLGLIYFIIFLPFFLKNDFSVKKLTYTINKRYIIFSVVFIICSLITIKVYYNDVKNLLITGNWMENRNELYSGRYVIQYNFIEYCALQFSNYTKLIATIVGFAMLRSKTNKKINLLGFCNIICFMIVDIMSAINTSSRGAIVNLFLLIVSMYLFFYKDFNVSKRRFVKIIFCIFLICIIPYVISVTFSRFSSNSTDSLISYFGMSPVVFNNSVFNITKHLHGAYAFGNLFTNINFRPDMIGGTWGTNFYTFVGWMYIDWGLIGTFLISISISFFLFFKIKKKKYYISDIYIIFFIYYTLLQGTFVIGRDYCYNIVSAIVIYFFLRFIFDKTIFVGIGGDNEIRKS